ncbi:hypothetical protein [Streptomyces sp. BP-8]|uniref:SMODS and SLOG-associating 2TM effector domain-containing protein n=1 Tax=Streptomyces sirii TaxID=3127701 RepID=A0ABZ2QHC8_9ACTN
MAAYEAFSVLFRAADGNSLEDQRRYLPATKCQMGALVAAAALSVFSRHVNGVDVVAAAFVVATMSSCAQWPVTEAEWATFAANAEGVVSREHTLWRPSHM